MTGVLRCATHKHVMMRVAEHLWLCECSETGESQHLKGIVEEARRLVFLAGGLDKIRADRKAKSKAKREANKAMKREAKEIYDTWLLPACNP